MGGRITSVARTDNGEPTGSRGYTFAGFSATDVVSFRGPFACAAVGNQLGISFLDAAVRTADDLDFVEEIEERVRKHDAYPGMPGELLTGLDRWFALKAQRREVAIFMSRLDASGTLFYASAGQSALLMDQHGYIRAATDLTPPLGSATGHEYRSYELPLQAGDVLVVHNHMFQRELGGSRLRTILLQTRGMAASAIRDRIAGQWARSEAALRHYEEAALFVLSPNPSGRPPGTVALSK